MEKYLPIGTVVLLKNANKKVMITGFASISKDTGNKIFDYSGCMYPEGFMSYNEVLVFDHSQIGEIVNMGYVNDEEIEFKNELNDKIDELINSVNNVNM